MNKAASFRALCSAALFLTNGQLQAADVAPRPSTSLGQSDIAQVTRGFLDRISPHMPMYFIYGAKSPEMKFQLSLKYRLLGTSSDGQRNGLYMGYTQRSLWDVGAPSSPFFDTSYMPELMWESLASTAAVTRGSSWLGYQAGLQHESNGRDGAQSRSLNQVYVRPLVKAVSLDGWDLLLAPKVLSYLSGLKDNPDIPRYRGYVEWMAVLGKNDGPALIIIDRAGSHFDRNSLEVNLTFPLRVRRLDFASYFLVQWFEGYGESILDYNHRSSILRGGIALVR